LAKKGFCYPLRILMIISLGLVSSGCSDISLFTLLSNEQEGEFALDDEIVNVREGEEYQVSARGGFLPYTYSIISGGGSIDSQSGLFSAPVGVSGYLEVEIECFDRFDTRDTTKIRVFQILSADRNSFSTRVGAANEPVSVSGGVGDYTISAILGKIYDAGGTAEIGTGTGPAFSFQYKAPAVKGTDFITVTDELNNSLSITVEVLPPEGSELELFPSFMILKPGDPDSTFDVFGGIGGDDPDYFSFELEAGSDGSLVLPPMYNSVDSRWEVTYQVPAGDGSAVLTVANRNPVTLELYGQVSSDIYVMTEDPPALEIKPSFRLSFSGRELSFTAAGGIPPYEFAIISGGGSLEQVSATEAVLETDKPSPIVIRLTDAVETSAQANVFLLF